LRSYGEELREMERQSREEYVGSVRRKSSGFSRGVSKYRGVARFVQFQFALKHLDERTTFD
jgi:hypothetical protein